MDEYSISYPMHAPLLESTAVADEKPPKISVETRDQISSSLDSLMDSSISKSLNGDTHNKLSLDSFKDNDDSIGQCTEVSELLGETRKSVINSSELTNGEVNASTYGHSGTTALNIEYGCNNLGSQQEGESAHVQKSTRAHYSIPRDAATVQDDSIEKDVVGQQSTESCGHIATRVPAIARYRFNPLTDKYEEIIPAVTKINFYASQLSSSSTSSSPVCSSSVANSASSEKNKSPWELWLLRKAKENLEKQQQLKYELLQREKEKAKLRDMKSKKMTQAAAVHEEWVRKKTAEERSQRRAREEERRLHEQAEQKKHHMVQTKANASFIEWKQRKEREQEQLQEKTRVLIEQKEQEQRKCRETATHAYRVWLRSVGCKRINKELLCPDTGRNYVFSHPERNRLRKWHFY